MMKQAALGLLLCLGLGAECAQAQRPTSAAARPSQVSAPWAAMAEMDLQAIHDLLAANHPGPVDPQNPAYAVWLKKGLALAQAKAQNAAAYPDYQRALRFYLNGFRDGHIGGSFTMEPNRLTWPGFLVRRYDADGKVRVAFAREGGSVAAGAELVSCDGKPVEALMAERLDPYWWNADIPHARWATLPNLFVVHPSDAAWRMKSCTFADGGEPKTIPLAWTSDPRATVNGYLEKVAPPPKQLGLRQIGNIWFVTIPSFNYSGEGAAGIKALIEELNAKSPALRQAKVVLDVRGNGGGNSSWGSQIASSLWGDALVRRVANSFDWTVDWRVSPDNLAHLESIVDRNRKDGVLQAAESWEKARNLMVEAQAKGLSLARDPRPPARSEGAKPANPVSGRIFLLTDGACASACLDFADLVRRLPNATHIGLPTSADAIYIDNTGKLLPSGLFFLSYSLKVYRSRVRANNQWYEPQVRWPGGEMTDQALARWIGQLS
jgi:hypothetical protein